MALTPEQLEQFRQFIKRSSAVNKKQMRGIVPNLIKNSPKFFGSERKKNFFYRQWENLEDADGWNMTARYFALLAEVFSVKPASGEELMLFAESFFEWLRSTRAETPEGSVWEAEEEIDVLRSKIKTAIGKGDKQTVRELTAKVLPKQKRVPMYLKARTKIKQTKNGKVRFFTK